MFETKLGAPAGPFQNAVPKFDYWSTAHSLAAERLEFAVGSSILLTVFTGEPGSGKSTVVRKVVSDAQGKRLIGVCTHGPAINVDPCRAILESFGADAGTGDKASHQRILQQSLEAARTEHALPTFVLDDADKLKVAQFSNLCDLARLSNGPENALFKIILVGKPGLADQLDDELSLLLGPTFTLEPMSEEDTAGYVRHRLEVAEFGSQPFDDGALSAIHERTGGNPKQINLLCQAALDEAAALGIARIDAKWMQDCKIAPLREFELGQKAQATAPPLSGPLPGSDAARPAPAAPGVKPSAPADKPKPPPAPAPSPYIERALKTARAERPKPERKPPDQTAAPQAGDGPPSFKSNRTSGARSGDKGATGAGDLPGVTRPPTEARAAPGRTKPARTETAPETTPEPATPPSTPRRKRLVLTALFAGVAGLAALTYVPASLNDEVAELPGDGADAMPGTGGQAVGDDGSTAATVAVDRETSAITASLQVPEMTAPAIEDHSGLGLTRPDTQPAVAPAAVPDPAAAREVAQMRAIHDVFGDLPQDPGGWYRLGLSVADRDPRAAAVAYTLAAAGDHPRAAYFLGQIYELGEGIPVDTMLARYWYGVAGDRIAAAGERLAALEAPAAAGAPATPVPLFSFIARGGEAVMVWTSGTGPDPDSYAVEFLDASGQVVGRTGDVKAPFLRQVPPVAAHSWRVSAHPGAGPPAAPTGWIPLDVQAEGATGTASADP